MADGDKITIKSIEWDESNLPKWATERTLAAIAVKLKAIQANSASSKKSNQQTAKTQNDYQKMIKQGMNASARSSKAMVDALRSKSNDYTKDLVKKNIKTPFSSVNDALQKFAGRMGIVGAVLGTFATAVGLVIGRLKQFSDAYRQAFSMGFRFEQGSLGLAKAALRAEMGISEFSELLGKYSTTIGITGVQSFADLNMALRDNLQSVGNLGMSYNELTEYTADYLEQLRGANLLTSANNDELEAMAETYIRNITAFSQLANVSRDQINATIKASTSIEAFANRIAMLSPAIAKNALAAAQSIAGLFAGLGIEFGDQLATTFTQAYGRGGLFFTEAGRQLLAVNKNLYNSMDNIIRNLDNLDGDSAAKAASDMIAQFENVSDAERERLGIIERSNTEYSSAARDQIALIRRVEQLRENGALEQYKDLQKLRQDSNIDKLSVAFVGFERVMVRLKQVFNTFFTELFGDGRILNMVEGSMDGLSKQALKFADFVKDLAGKVGSIMAKIVNFIGDLFDSTKQGASGLFLNIFSPLKSLLTDGISAGLARGIAIAIPDFGLGVNAEMLNKMDNLATAYRESKGTDKERENLNKLYDYIYNTSTVFGQELPANLFGKRGEDFEDVNVMLDKLREFKYGVNLDGNENRNVENQNNNNDPEKGVETSMMDPGILSNAKMRIMKQYLPMSGSTDPTEIDSETEYYRSSLNYLRIIANATTGTATSVGS